MFDAIRAIILGAVEGITEFLPVSSTGHLILVNEWVHFEASFTKMFDVVIQVGAILAVVIYFWRKLFPFAHTHVERVKVMETWKKTLIGVIPAILIGATIGHVVEEKLFNTMTVAIALLVGGVILVIIERPNRHARIDSMSNLTYSMAFWIGLIQCLAMIPGTSRSGATIVGAMLLGASRFVAVEFSFFLAIPTLIAASGYTLLKHASLFTWHQTIILSIGFVTSFIVALAVISVFMTYISKRDFKAFGVYRIILAVLVFAYFGLKGHLAL